MLTNMVTRAPLAIASTESVIAMLLAAAGVDHFVPRLWPQHRALRELAERPPQAVAHVTREWLFRPSADGGHALAGLERLFLRLTGDGWLVRLDDPEARYAVTPRLRTWGQELLDSLEDADRRQFEITAQRLRATLSTASK